MRNVNTGGRSTMAKRYTQRRAVKINQMLTDEAIVPKSEAELDRRHHKADEAIARAVLEWNPKERMTKDRVEVNRRQRWEIGRKGVEGGEEPGTEAKSC